jgi:hypothetical protein
MGEKVERLRRAGFKVDPAIEDDIESTLSNADVNALTKAFPDLQSGKDGPNLQSVKEKLDAAHPGWRTLFVPY